MLWKRSQQIPHLHLISLLCLFASQRLKRIQRKIGRLPLKCREQGSVARTLSSACEVIWPHGVKNGTMDCAGQFGWIWDQPKSKMLGAPLRDFLDQISWGGEDPPLLGNSIPWGWVLARAVQKGIWAQVTTHSLIRVSLFLTVGVL